MASRILALDHIQIAMPPGREAEARDFYTGLLGFLEQEKPALLAARGGCWFASGSVKLHLGVETDFAPARKAHPAFIVTGLSALVAALERAGYRIARDVPLPGFDRCFVNDPFGNRIELMARQA